MDLSLIGWILLFLSVCLDASGTCGGSVDVADKSKDRDQGRVTFTTAFHGLTTTVVDSFYFAYIFYANRLSGIYKNIHMKEAVEIWLHPKNFSREMWLHFKSCMIVCN
jgi:hypothetical protein